MCGDGTCSGGGARAGVRGGPVASVPSVFFPEMASA